MDEMKIRCYAEILNFNEGEGGLYEIQIAPLGKWMHSGYGEMNIKDEDLADAVNEFEASKRAEIQMNYDHKEGKASGWIKRLIHKVGQGLFAMVKFTPTAIDFIRNQEYKYISPEWYTNFKDKNTKGRVWKMRIAGAALTNIPYFDGMKPVEVFSEQTQTLYMADEVDEAQEIADAANIEVDVQQNLSEEKDKMDLEKIKKALGIEGEVSEDAIVERFSELSTELAHVKNEREQASGRITGLEEALETFKEKVGQMEVQRFSEKVESVIGKAMAENRLTKEKADKFKALINEENFVQMSELINDLPAMEAFKEAGSPAVKVNGNQSYFAEVEKTSRERGISYRQACEIVDAEKPGLFKADENEIPFKASEVKDLFKD